ncbi:hypothetical protein [Nonomuraea sp. NPDC050783]|uniref:hypothetical protein n=1 Tax=Nonomuraea sp. NPDC050783 TaxID=3154634 RepID=UPI0034655872
MPDHPQQGMITPVTSRAVPRAIVTPHRMNPLRRSEPMCLGTARPYEKDAMGASIIMKKPIPNHARTLQDRIAHWSESTGIAVEVWALPKVPLPRDMEGLLVRVMGTMFAAIEGHGQARTVSFALTLASSGLRMTISDDGPGMAVELLRSRLSLERDRMTALGGGLTLNSVAQGGTTLTCGIPYIAVPAKSRLVSLVS